jgi:glyoxylase-like metal-dependent hydrolase (beta-lactamase superfamily II)
VTPVDDGGGRLRAGGFGLMMIHAPGHIAGHARDEFATEDGRRAFIADTVLPVYTPNVGGSDCLLDNSLPEDLASLSHLADRADDRLWPGHCSVIHEPW